MAKDDEYNSALCDEKKKTWKKKGGVYVCKAKECRHFLKGGGCKLGKVSNTCDNNECHFNKHVGYGIYRCGNMDIHLDANGKCVYAK